jgi:hypothetical protein
MPLDGFDVQASASLAGSKRAVRMGRTIYVSPAMYDLICHAKGAELERLLGAIRCLKLPEPPSIFDPLPMTTNPWDRP